VPRLRQRVFVDHRLGAGLLRPVLLEPRLGIDRGELFAHHLPVDRGHLIECGFGGVRGVLRVLLARRQRPVLELGEAALHLLRAVEHHPVALQLGLPLEEPLAVRELLAGIVRRPGAGQRGSPVERSQRLVRAVGERALDSHRQRPPVVERGHRVEPGEMLQCNIGGDPHCCVRRARRLELHGPGLQLRGRKRRENPGFDGAPQHFAALGALGGRLEIVVDPGEQPPAVQGRVGQPVDDRARRDDEAARSGHLELFAERRRQQPLQPGRTVVGEELVLELTAALELPAALEHLALLVARQLQLEAANRTLLVFEHLALEVPPRHGEDGHPVAAEDPGGQVLHAGLGVRQRRELDRRVEARPAHRAVFAVHRTQQHVPEERLGGAAGRLHQQDLELLEVLEVGPGVERGTGSALGRLKEVVLGQQLLEHPALAELLAAHGVVDVDCFGLQRFDGDEVLFGEGEEVELGPLLSARAAVRGVGEIQGALGPRHRTLERREPAVE
jgi:hypothetical protein